MVAYCVRYPRRLSLLTNLVQINPPLRPSNPGTFSRITASGSSFSTTLPNAPTRLPLLRRGLVFTRELYGWHGAQPAKTRKSYLDRGTFPRMLGSSDDRTFF